MVEVNIKLMDLTGKYGCLKSVQILRAHDPPCPWDEQTCGNAAYSCHLHVLQWARSQDPPCPWSVWACFGGALGGQLSVQQWARSQNPPCPWDWYTCRAAAAKGGHLDVLQWLLSYDPSVTSVRVRNEMSDEVMRSSKVGNVETVL